MATVGGNNSVRDGLVFYYDTGNKYRSFKGEPTTNLINNPIPTSVTNYHYKPAVFFSGDEDGNYIRWKVSSYATWGAYFFNDSLFSYVFDISSEYTASFKWKFGPEHTADNNYSFQIVNGNGTDNVSGSFNLINNSVLKPDGWYYFSKTFTPNNDGSSGDKQYRIICGDKGAGVVSDILWKELQFEKKDRPTPFTPNTRTITDSLFDLFKNQNIDVSNVSFDVSGNPSFDGVDDHILLPEFTGFSGQQEATIEFWVQRNSASSNGHVIWASPSVLVEYTNGSSIRVRWYQNVVDTWGTQYNMTGLNFSPTEQVVVTFNAGNLQMFFQGELLVTGTNSGDTLTGVPTGMKLMYRETVDAIDGKLPIVKIYNKALTPDEVKRNFNSYKGRFNL